MFLYSFLASKQGQAFINSKGSIIPLPFISFEKSRCPRILAEGYFFFNYFKRSFKASFCAKFRVSLGAKF